MKNHDKLLFHISIKNAHEDMKKVSKSVSVYSTSSTWSQVSLNGW